MCGSRSFTYATPNHEKFRCAKLTIAVFAVPCALLGGTRSTSAQPIAMEDGWVLQRVIEFENGQAAHFNPVDGKIYVGRRRGSSRDPEDGVYRVEEDGSTVKVSDGDRVACVVVDPHYGDVFFSEDYGGRIYRVPVDGTDPELWVSGFHSGDDDPVGMAFAPLGYQGEDVEDGEVRLVDRGYNGPDEVWQFWSDESEGETRVHADNGLLEDAVDVTIGDAGVFVADRSGGPNGSGRLFRLENDGSLAEIVTTEVINPTGLAMDPVSGLLMVLDADGDRVVWVDPDTGQVDEFLDGFSFTMATVDTPWAGVDVTPDGNTVIVTDRGAHAIYVFGFVEELDEEAVAERILELAATIRSLDLRLFDAPNRRAAAGRRNALANRADDAAASLLDGDLDDALESLHSLLVRVDGGRRPKDWLVASTERDALAEQCADLMAMIEEL